MISKILIITESMMPFTSNWGACQRIYHYAKKMVSEGIGVTVICHNTSDKKNSTENVDGITVIGHGGRVVSTQPMNSGGGAKANLRKKLQAVDRKVKVISKVVRSTYRFVYSEPNVLSGRSAKQWASSVIPYAIDYIKREEIDAVILSGPTFGLFYHADEIKKIGVKLILDYRDPWVSWYEKPTLAAIAEKKAIGLADLVVTTTDTLTKALNEKYRTSKCHTVMNGYDKQLWETIDTPEHDPNKLIISYIGNIKINRQPGGFRDPTVFFETVKDFKSKHPETVIQFIGVQTNLDEIDPTLKGYVDFQNTVPVAESLELTARADVLLVFHTALDPSGKYIICGKAFDCLRSGNFVLSVGDKAFANKALVQTTGIGIHCDNNHDAILTALEDIYAKWRAGKLIDKGRDTERYSRDYQNSQFLRLIRAIPE